jgi:hypothetical protein
MPFVICPSCERVTYGAAAFRVLELCRYCGEVLPMRRSVVPVTARPFRGALDPPSALDPSDLPPRRGSDPRLRRAAEG